MRERVLVIRHGALGDLCLSFAPFAAIRAHHPAAAITLLTTAPFASLAVASPWFDRVLVDRRPRWWQPVEMVRLGHHLRGYDRVYDLQTSARSRRYHLFGGAAEWSGIGRRVSHPHSNPDRDRMHTLERQREQLAVAGVPPVPVDLGWLAKAPAPDVAAPFALLIPGASPRRPAKRWPAERFGALAEMLAKRGVTPVTIGTATESDAAATIVGACPAAIDLTGQTDIPAIAALAARASLAVGNDTGPMHLAAAMGAPCVVLFSAESDPALTAPRTPGGGWPTILRRDNLAELSLATVAAACEGVLDGVKPPPAPTPSSSKD